MSAPILDIALPPTSEVVDRMYQNWELGHQFEPDDYGNSCEHDHASRECALPSDHPRHWSSDRWSCWWLHAIAVTVAWASRIAEMPRTREYAR